MNKNVLWLIFVVVFLGFPPALGWFFGADLIFGIGAFIYSVITLFFLFGTLGCAYMIDEIDSAWIGVVFFGLFFWLMVGIGYEYLQGLDYL